MKLLLALVASHSSLLMWRFLPSQLWRRPHQLSPARQAIHWSQDRLPKFDAARWQQAPS